MDKFEYNVRASEIKTLIQEGNFAEAAVIADTIDWRRVKSIMMLCTVSDIYKINRRYKESKDILTYAYDRNPGGRLILYHLCELSLKLGEFVQAVEYYKEFVRVAPKDNSRYILQYKIYEAQDVSLEERIAILEELKKREYKEKWAYELAYLYHRVGLATKCIEECDEIFLWFGKGKYVIKALELKQLHISLTEDQSLRLAEAKPENGYGELDSRNDPTASNEEELMSDDTYAGGFSVNGDFSAEEGYADEQASMGYGNYGEEAFGEDGSFADDGTSMGYEIPRGYETSTGYGTPTGYETSAGHTPAMGYENSTEYETPMGYQVPTGYYETSMENEALTGYDPSMADGVPMSYESSMGNGMPTGYEPTMAGDTPSEEERPWNSGETDIKNSDTKEYPNVGKYATAPKPEEMDINVKPVDVSQYNTINLQQVVAESMKELLSDPDEQETPAQPPQTVQKETRRSGETEVYFGDTADMPGVQEPLPTAASVQKKSDPPVGKPEKPVLTNTGVIKAFNKVSGYDQILTQEYDGQIGLVVPDETKVEKQITGQLKIVDILAEWERQKKEIEQKRMEEVRNKVRKQTDTLFADFDEATKSGLLEKLEKAMVDAVIRGNGKNTKPSVIKVADIGAEEKLNQAMDSLATEPEDEEVRRLLAMDDEMPENDDDESLFIPENTEADEAMANDMMDMMSAATIADNTSSSAATVTDKTTPAASAAAPGTTAMTANAAVPTSTNTITSAVTGAAHTAASAAIDAVHTTADAATTAAGMATAVTTATIGAANTTSNAALTKTDSTDRPAETTGKNTTATEPSRQAALHPTDRTDATPGQTSHNQDGATLKADSAAENTAETGKDNPTDPTDATATTAVRELNEDEKARFGRFVQHKKTRRQLIAVIENISLAAYTGNVIVTGEESIGTMKVAKELIKGVQQSDHNFSGKVAKISGEILNKKDLAATFSRLENGAVIVEKASRMKPETVNRLLKVLEQENTGYIVILEDQKAAANQLVERNPGLSKAFNLRVDLEALDDQSLVAFAQKYALEMEYAIDDFGILALHTRIADLQTIDHEVTVAEVQEMVEEAIYYADKKNPKHFFDILLGKRYDKEDMIILRESDFMHY